MAEVRISVGRMADLPPGTKKMVNTPLETVLVVNVQGEFFAVSNMCPHTGGWLVYGPLTGYMLECPLHYWPFDVRTGLLIGMDNLGLDEHLNTYPTLIENEEVYIIMSGDL